MLGAARAEPRDGDGDAERAVEAARRGIGSDAGRRRRRRHVAGAARSRTGVGWSTLLLPRRAARRARPARHLPFLPSLGVPLPVGAPRLLFFFY